MNRRYFLMETAMAAAALSAAPLITGCSGVTRRDLPSDRGMHTALRGDVIEMLRLASLAPSGHNTQPWTVSIVDDRCWLIGNDDSRWLPGVDPAQRETLLSIGAFLENLAIAAAHVGLHAEVEVLGQSAQDKRVVRVQLFPAATSQTSVAAVEARRTIRTGFSSGEISSEDILYVTGGEGNNIAYFTPASPAGKYMSEGTIQANRIQSSRRIAQEELADWIRWTDADAAERRDGLTPEMMDIGGIAGWYVRHFYDRNDALTVDFGRRSVAKVIEQVDRLGGWIVITSADSSLPALLDAGRRMERLFLRACEKKIAVHPMTQMLEEDPWRAVIAREVGASDVVQFILRVGYVSSYPDPVSLRRPPQWFLRG